MKKFVTLAIVATVMTASASAARAQVAPLKTRFAYSVKFVCGVQPGTSLNPPSEPPVKPGNYATAINIHNFHFKQSAGLCKKAVIALPEDVTPRGAIGNVLRLPPLLPDEAIEVDCADIVKLLPSSGVPLPPFIKGFVELRSDQLLSVVAVYTAQGCDATRGCAGPVSLEVVPQTVFNDLSICQ